MATAYRTSPGSVGELTDIDTVQRNPLGLIVEGRDVNGFLAEYIYLKGVASTAVGLVVSYDELGATQLVDSDDATTIIGPVAVALAATVASTYGWYQIGGLAVVKVLAAFADNKAVWATSTGGSVDDAVVAGNQIIGMMSRSAIDTPSTGYAYIQCNRPWIGVSVV